MKLQVGEEAPSAKDTSGRFGPADVVDVSAHDDAWKFIRSEVEGPGHGCLLQLCRVLHDDHWTLASNTSGYPGLMSAMKFFAEYYLPLSNVISVRIGHGIRNLPSIIAYSTAVVIV